MFDADNDGDLDIHVTNGHVIDNVKLYRPTLTYAQKDLLYENVRRAVPRRHRAGRGGAAGDARRPRTGGRGLRQRRQSRRRHHVRSDQRAVLLRNQGARAGNWIMIRAKGKKSNGFGLGATVTIETTEGRQVREINNTASYVSSNDIRLHVGLGAAKIIRQIEMLWPSGTRQILKDVAVNQVLVIEEP